MREAELYPPLKQHFERLGYAVHAEVPAAHGGYVDLLGIREQVSVAVELKSSFSRIAVRQARRNQHYVWESYVAIPESTRIRPGRRAALKRNGLGLLAVGPSGVRTLVEARRQAPAQTIHQAFGRYLEGGLQALYAGAIGGVPAGRRASAFKELTKKVKEALETQGGLANTDHILAATLGWNYFRHPRGGLRWILERHFLQVAPDLWALPDSSPGRHEPLSYELAAECLVRTHLPETYVCLPPPPVVPRPGDLVILRQNGQIPRRARVISAERHAIVETAQRELRAGPAIFFPWRCPREQPLPGETLVLRLAPVRKQSPAGSRQQHCGVIQ